MIIRYVKTRDAAQLIQLCAAHAEFEKIEYNSRGKLDQLSLHLFDHHSPLNCLVVEEDSEIVGYATFMKQFSTWDANFYVYLDCLFLTESTRGKGIGYQLMNKIKAYALSNGCDHIQWQTPQFNLKAIEFYHNLGAVHKSKERFFWTI